MKKVTLPLILIALICGSFLAYTSDMRAVQEGRVPRFSHTEHVLDGGTILHTGLGYQIVQWHHVVDSIDSFGGWGHLVGLDVFGLTISLIGTNIIAPFNHLSP